MSDLEARKEGRDARRDGVPRCKNPHPVLTEAHDEWNDGHLDFRNAPTNQGYRFRFDGYSEETPERFV